MQANAYRDSIAQHHGQQNHQKAGEHGGQIQSAAAHGQAQVELNLLFAVEMVEQQQGSYQSKGGEDQRLKDELRARIICDVLRNIFSFSVCGVI